MALTIGSIAQAQAAGAVDGKVGSATSSTFVYVYQDQGNLNKGTSVIGTISGTSISYGSETLFTNGTYENIYPKKVICLTSTKVILAYVGPSYCYLIAGDISSGTVTWGTRQQLTTNNGEIDIVALSSSTFAVSYNDSNDSNYLNTAICSVSGTTITINTAYRVYATAYSVSNIDALSSTKIVIAYQNGQNNDTLKCKIGDISGTTITLGSETVISASAIVGARTQSLCVLDSSTFGVVYNLNSNGYCYGRVATVSGTTPTFGTAFNITTGYPSYNTLRAYNASSMYMLTQASSLCKLFKLNVSSTTITLDSTTSITASDAIYEDMTKMSDGYFVGSCAYSSNSYPQAFTINDPPTVGPANLKTFNGLTKSSVKTINGLSIGSIKTINSLS